MAATREPRLRLSRRRPPSGGGPQGGCPWLLRGGGSESERLWAELLRTVSPDLTLDVEPPPLPARPGQESRDSPERAAPPEVFTVGPKTFSWTPFPPAPAGPGRSYGPLREAGGCPESPTRSPQVRPASEPCGTPSAEEQLAVEGALALQSCPMCQQEFAPGLTQLDVDSHLAQCLAESTEDVAW
ncbi:Fanconi anemia core complex-associated protein 20 [Eulemur rufifrons]|uniref:Fanconi anemia core complex-associated protein 20 n=1 Tax=Eulemur rufifrons TaxID=859984 RepID=UPI0037428A76